MVARTSGKDCGKQDGDYMRWTNSSWSLQGSAEWIDVSAENLCRKYSSIQLFLTQGFSIPQKCETLCSRPHKEGRMASAETPELVEQVENKIGKVANSSSRFSAIVAWLPMQFKNNILVDSYTGKEISKPQWHPGYPVNDSSRSCIIIGSGESGYANWPCEIEESFYCTCHFPQHPIYSGLARCQTRRLVPDHLGDGGGGSDGG